MDNFKFKKSFGQNFLKDNNIINNIVKSADIKENSLVIEVGPGAGALTNILADYAKSVLCYEIDDRLEDTLYELISKKNNIEVIFDDFLKRDIASDIENYEYENLYVVANLPYYITTPIIEKIINSKINFKSITIMIQKEVGDRFSAKVGNKDYSSITVFLNYYYDIKKLFIVNRNSFVPKPNVDSVVISLVSKENRLELDNEELFFRLIRDSFKFKRKNIRNNLKNYDLSIIEKVLLKYDFDLSVRAEQLSLEIFVDIANNLSKNK